jgi:hypothetical protein
MLHAEHAREEIEFMAQRESGDAADDETKDEEAEDDAKAAKQDGHGTRVGEPSRLATRPVVFDE